MERGLVAGYPVVDLRVTLVDGKAHSVDSSDAAFQTAGALALREAADQGQVTLLEPVDEVVIRVPDSYVGAVMSDLSGRRGRVLGTEADSEATDRTLVRAEVPATELVRYAVELRSMTSGSGTFRRSFARYEPMPAHLVEQVRKEHAATSRPPLTPLTPTARWVRPSNWSAGPAGEHSGRRAQPCSAPYAGRPAGVPPRPTARR